jgi:uridylate kinase
VQDGSTPEDAARADGRTVNGTAVPAGAVAVDRATAGETAVAGRAHPADRGWHRVVLKLSGQAFAGGEPLGISPGAVIHIAQEISAAAGEGIQVAAVVGGGNMFRGAALSQRGIDRSRADYMGMLGTVINCLALQDVLEKLGVETRVQTAITMRQGRGALRAEAGDPEPGKGPGRDLRIGPGRAVLLDRYLRGPAYARGRGPGGAQGHPGRRGL